MDGATVSVNGNVAVGTIRAKTVDDHGKSPHVKAVSAVISGGTINVSATIEPGTAGDPIKDARAELIGYNTGSVMGSSGSSYSASIDMPTDAGGPYIAVVVFAIDTDNRVGTGFALAGPFSGAGGPFSIDTINGSWSGSVKFHRRDVLRGFPHRGNAVLNFAGGQVNGTYTEPRLRMLAAGTEPPFKDKHLSDGVVTLVDSTAGLYAVEFTVDNEETIKLLGKLNSAGNPTDFVGIVRIREDVSNVVAYFGGRFHLKNQTAFSWSVADLSPAWTWSNFMGSDVNSTDIIGTYKPPFQFNEALDVSTSGAVTAGATTVGLSVSSGGFSVIDSTLGKYTGSITLSDGATIEFWFLMGFGKQRVFGVKKITSGSTIVYGTFWGHKRENAQWYQTSDLAGWFAGHITVTSGPNSGNTYKALIKMNSAGGIEGGFIRQDHLLITGGNIAFVNTASGEINGSATGSGFTFTIAPSGARNASMGVYKYRLVGDFKLESSDGTDTGYFFIHRIHKTGHISN